MGRIIPGSGWDGIEAVPVVFALRSSEPLQGFVILGDLAQIPNRQGTDYPGPQIGTMARNAAMESFGFVFHKLRIPAPDRETL